MYILRKILLFIILSILLYQNSSYSKETLKIEPEEENSLIEEEYIYFYKKKEDLEEIAKEERMKKKIKRDLNLNIDLGNIANIQLYRLKKLQNGCIPPKSKKFCYSNNIDFYFSKKNHQIASTINIGYSFNKNITFGMNFAHNLKHHLPQYYRIKQENNYIHSGFYSYFNTGVNKKKYWYVKPAISTTGYNVEMRENYSEVGGTKIRAYSLGIEGGKNTTYKNNTNIKWYLGFNKSKISIVNEIYPREFEIPERYKNLKRKDRTIYIGTEIKIPFFKKFEWISGFNIEHTTRKPTPTFDFTERSEEILIKNVCLPRIRETLQTNLTYQINKNIKLSISGAIENNDITVNGYGSFNISGKF